jgi:diguanylate cyclase (GGDEF)-like protein/PAS domain S-box-containing protein
MDVDSFLQLADTLPEALLLLDTSGDILAVNRKAIRFLETSPDDLKGKQLADFLENSSENLQQTMRHWSRSRAPIPATIKWKHVPHEEVSNIQCQGFLLKPAKGDDRAWLVLRCVLGRSITRQFKDLTAELERYKAVLRKLNVSRKALAQEHERALVTLHSIGDAVITTDSHGRVEYLNPIAEQLTGWESHMAAEHPIGEVFHIINEVTRQPALDPVHRCLKEGRIVGLANHTALISREGDEYIIEDSAAPIRDWHGNILGVVLVFRDVTGDRLAQRQLEYLAQHDTLTGLKNRYFFEQQLEHTVNMASRGQHVSALLYIDLDQFKVVNDSAGHAAGDELLVEAAQRFNERTRKGDILARLGGDEFGVILDVTDVDQLEEIADSYNRALEGFKFQWDGGEYEVTCSIGCILIDKTITTPAEALRQCDIACYVAKHKGRNRSHVYTEDDEHAISTLGEMSVVNEIKSALEDDRFVLHFQPIKCVGDDSIVIHEALLRLKQKDDSLTGPGNFIPIAERYGLMAHVDTWVIKQAISLLQKSCTDGTICQITVNLSGVSLGDNLILEILKAFARENAEAAKHLILEITETVAVTHLDKASIFIKELRELGIRFALDDFGTGFSSFSYLKHLPVDFIKIDGTFVRDIANDPVDQAMVRSINHIAHSLDKLTIAEFVEDNEILDLLKDIGVDMVQGYYIGKPGPDLNSAANSRH